MNTFGSMKYIQCLEESLIL